MLSGGLAKNPIKLPSGCFFNLALPSLFLAMPATTDGSGAALTPRLIIAYDRKFAGITVAGQWLVLDPKSSKLLASNWAQTQIHEWLDKAVYPTAFTSAFFNSNAQRGIFVSIGQTPVLEFTYQ